MASMATEKRHGRLPTNVVPRHYSIRMRPDLELFVFDGDVNVTLEVREATTSLTLHAKELDICFGTCQH